MASFQKTLYLDALTVKNIYTKGEKNSNVPQYTVLTSDGNGGTVWTSTFVGDGTDVQFVTAVALSTNTNYTIGSGSFTASTFIGDGSQLGNVVGIGLESNRTYNIASGSFIASTITGGIFYGDGSQLVNVASSGLMKGLAYDIANGSITASTFYASTLIGTVATAAVANALIPTSNYAVGTLQVAPSLPTNQPPVYLDIVLDVEGPTWFNGPTYMSQSNFDINGLPRLNYNVTNTTLNSPGDYILQTNGVPIASLDETGILRVPSIEVSSLVVSTFFGTFGSFPTLEVSSLTAIDGFFSTLRVSSFTGANGYFSTLRVSSFTGVNGYFSTLGVSSLTAIDGFFSTLGVSLFTGVNGSFSTLGVSSFTGANGSFSTLGVSSFTGANGSFSTLGVSSFTGVNGSFSTLGVSLFTGANGSFSTLGVSSFTGVNGSFSTLGVSSLTGANGSFSTLVVSSISAGNIYGNIPYSAVTTLAGTGSPGFNDGPGTSATFRSPNEVAVDSSGFVYVTDITNHSIRKISPSGQVTTLAGTGLPGSNNGPGISATFNFPQGVAVDSSGFVYVADTNNDLIRMITPIGEVTTIAGSSRGSNNGYGTNAQLNGPFGIAVDSSSNLYISDSGRICILFNSNQYVSTFAGIYNISGSNDGYGTNAMFSGTRGLAVDSLSNVYIADSGNNKIRKISPIGEVTTLAGTGLPGSNNGTNATFNRPNGIAVDSSGFVYVGDNGNNLIRMIDQKNSNVTILAGTGASGFSNGSLTTAQFYSPYGITVDSSRNLYVADSGNNRIRKIIQDSNLLINADNVGINCNVPEYTLDVNGSIHGVSGSISNLYTDTFFGTLGSFSNLAVSSFTGVNGSFSTFSGVNGSFSTLRVSSFTGANGSFSTLGVSSFTGANGSFSTLGVSSFTGANGSFSTLGAFSFTGVNGSFSTLRVSSFMGVNGSFSTLGVSSFTSVNGSFSTLRVSSLTGANVSFSTLGVSSFTGNLGSFSSLGVSSFTGVNGSFSTLGVSSFTGANGSFSTLGVSSFTGFNGSFSTLYVSSMSAGNISGNYQYTNVTTFAGGSATGTNDGFIDATGTNALFYTPYLITVDSSGYVYVADYNNNRIRKISPLGEVNTLAGSGSPGSNNSTGTNATFDEPIGVAVDSSSNVYVADYINNLIRKIDPNSNVTTFVSFSNPIGIAVDSSGFVYVADQTNNRIRKIDPTNSNITTLAGSGSAGSTNSTGTNATFNIPNGIAVDSSSNVYVSDSGNNLIRKIDPNSNVTTFATFNKPYGIAVDSSGYVYVADFDTHRIGKISPNGVVNILAGKSNVYRPFSNGSGTTATFFIPIGVAVDSSSNIYVGDSQNNIIRKINEYSNLLINADNVGVNCNAPLYTLDVNGSIHGLSGSISNVYTDTFFGTSGSFSTLRVTSFTGANGYFSTLAVSSFTGANGYFSTLAVSSFTGANGSFSTLGVSSFTGANGSFSNLGVSSLTGANGSFSTLYVSSITAGNIYGNYAYNLVINADNVGVNCNAPQYTLDVNGSIHGLSASIDNIISNPQMIPYGFTSTLQITQYNPPVIPTRPFPFVTVKGIAADSYGTLYTADQSFAVITTVSTNGVASILAGGGTTGIAFGNVNGIGTNALFDSGQSIVVLNGFAYYADSGNHNIRKINLNTREVTTLAGSTRGFTNNVIGTNAQFGYPCQMAFNNANTILYVADWDNRQIRQINLATSNVTTFVGGGGTNNAGLYLGQGTNALFLQSGQGLTVDTNDNVFYVMGSSILKITPDGIPSIFAGNPTFSGNKDGIGTNALFLDRPNHLSIDQSNNIYVSETYRVRMITPAGVVTTIAGGGNLGTLSGYVDGVGGNVAVFGGLWTILYNRYDNLLYVSDYNNNTIRTIQTQNTAPPVTNPLLLNPLSGNVGINTDNPQYTLHVNGNVWANSFGNSITPVASNTVTLSTVDNNIGNSWTSLVIAPNGTIYSVSADTNTIYRTIINTTVVYAGSATAGFSNGTGTNARFNLPYGLAIDSLGSNLYVTDRTNYNIRVINLSNASVTTLAGSQTQVSGQSDAIGTNALFTEPFAIALDQTNSNLYVGDRNVIRRINLATKLVSRVAGVVTSGAQESGSTDAVGTNVSFNYIYGLAIDKTNTNLYIADGNHKIRVMHIATSNVSTVAGAGGGSGCNASGYTNAVGIQARFNDLRQIAFDSSYSNLYMADYDNSNVRKLNIATQNVTTYTTNLFPNIHALDVAANDAVYIRQYTGVNTMSVLTPTVNNYVGINCNSPRFTFDVAGYVRANSLLLGGEVTGINQCNSSYLELFTYNSNTYFQSFTGSPTDTTNRTGNTIIFTNRYATLETLRISLSNQRVGINCNAPRYTLDVAGTINASGDIIAFSDQRVKTDIVTIDSALDKVNALRGVYYNRTDTDQPTLRHMGVIAQEVEQVLPEVVKTDSTEGQMKSVAYGNIVGVLIESIKELTQRLAPLETLSTQVATLQSTVGGLMIR